jgi:hypothetical protein
VAFRPLIVLRYRPAHWVGSKAIPRWCSDCCPSCACGVRQNEAGAGGAPDELLCELEWVFFSPLQHTRPPKALFRSLAANPRTFVELVTAVFKPKGEAATQQMSPAEAVRAQQAFRVLREWRQPPGLQSDATIDGPLLHEWVSTARQLLEAADRADIGDECIGEVLSGSPPGVDGIWPAEPIRQILEETDSPSFGQGLAIGKFNARGVTTRGAFEGGQQEDAIALEYEEWSRQVMARWPQTGRLLRDMARSYRNWARRHDAIAEEWTNNE